MLSRKIGIHTYLDGIHPMVVLLIGFALISALFWHALWRNFWGASLCAAFSGFVLSMVMVGHHVGFWGENFFEYAAGAIPTAFFVAVIVGQLIQRTR